jgi:all-trans-retinol 13,14-reductase
MRTDRELFFTADQQYHGPAFLTAEQPAKRKYFKPAQLLQNPDAIVIGSGIGGLGIASILAQKKGWKVLLLEANSVPGGCTHVHELEGYEFNSGIDSIGDMDPRVGRGLFRDTADFITGGQLKWARMPDVHEVCAFGDDVYQWHSSAEQNIEWVERDFAGEGDVRRYYDLEEDIEWWAWSWGLSKLLPEWMPAGLREAVYGATGGKWRHYMGRSTEEVFKEELGFSERLTAVYSYMYGNHGRTPREAPFAFHAANLYHYRNGAYYPVGGPGQIAECIVPILERAGGQLAVSCPVERILVEGDRAIGVRLADGQEVRCKRIISDASAWTTWTQLIEPELAVRHGYARKLEEVKPSPAHLYLFLGYDEELALPPEIIWQMPEYPGVDRYDLSTLDEIYKKQQRFEGMGGYVLSPSARDPVYRQRYPGKSTVIALAEAPPEWVARSRTDAAFDKEFRQAVQENLMKIVLRHMPQLKGKTPAYLRAGVPMGCNPRAWHGCSLGLEPSGDRFVKHSHWLRHQTKIDGLWLTGQDAFSPGFAGSMASARLCYSAMTGDWLYMLA